MVLQKIKDENFIINLVINFKWLLYPIYLVLKFFKICFVVNFFSGTGHILTESEFFLRKLKSGKIAKKRYIWIALPAESTSIIMKFHINKFYYAKSNTVLFYLVLPLILAFKDITLDCGLARMKYMINLENIKNNILLPKYMSRISRFETEKNWRDWIKLRKETSSYFPFDLRKLNEGKQKLIKDLNLKKKKTVLIHIKHVIMNALAKKIDPLTYLKALQYLQELEYQLIFVGREKMPEEFNDIEIIDYAGSGLASFENDLYVFYLADFAIISASGAAFFSACLNKPYLYLNSWHIGNINTGKKCIALPALVKDKQGQLLTFLEQIKLYYEYKNPKGEIFPVDKYDARNLEEEEILEGVKELIGLNQNYIERSELQNKFMNFYKPCFNNYNDARISEFFIKKFKHLLL